MNWHLMVDRNFTYVAIRTFLNIHIPNAIKEDVCLYTILSLVTTTTVSFTFDTPHV